MQNNVVKRNLELICLTFSIPFSEYLHLQKHTVVPVLTIIYILSLKQWRFSIWFKTKLKDVSETKQMLNSTYMKTYFCQKALNICNMKKSSKWARKTDETENKRL